MSKLKAGNRCPACEKTIEKPSAKEDAGEAHYQRNHPANVIPLLPDKPPPEQEIVPLAPEDMPTIVFNEGHKAE